MSTAIRMENIVKTYGETRVLNGLSLSIEEGTFLTVVGSSGCGKTTLLKMINGLIKPDSGKIMVKDQDLEQADLISLRRSIGYSIQGSILFPHMSVEENIAYVPNLLNGKDKEKTESAVRKWMKIVSLDDRLRTRYPDELSGGQQQRVGIARALASSPDILLMDEPFGAVDSITRSQLQSRSWNSRCCASARSERNSWSPWASIRWRSCFPIILSAMKCLRKERCLNGRSTIR